MTLTPEQLQILQHALGVNQYGGYDERPGCDRRNHFCAGGDDEVICRELVAMGLMRTFERSYPAVLQLPRDGRGQAIRAGLESQAAQAEPRPVAIPPIPSCRSRDLIRRVAQVLEGGMTPESLSARLSLAIGDVLTHKAPGGCDVFALRFPGNRKIVIIVADGTAEPTLRQAVADVTAFNQSQHQALRDEWERKLKS